MDKLKIEYIPLADITPYENNAKKHPEAQIEQIIQSIKEVGFNDPIGVWGGQSVIVEGHGRYEAAKRLGMETVPVVRLDHLTDAQRKAYCLLHNKTTMNSGFDEDKLEEELQTIIDAMPDFDLEQFGFNLDFTLPDDAEESLENLRAGEEIDPDDYSDDEFSCTCPRCGFKFNPEGN